MREAEGGGRRDFRTIDHGWDFNMILRLDERTGGNRWLSPDSLAFGEWVNDLSLIDLGFKDGRYTRLIIEETEHLSRPFIEEEVLNAVKSMGKYKASGPDGFQPVFYQQCWDTVGCSVTGVLPRAANDAIIVLMAKVVKSERITQFRPVSLCNVLFKIITKMMVIRLRRVISKLIGPVQASFISGRLSIDNIVVVQEAVHSMRRKKERKGWMLLKLDLEKTYDRIRWDFSEETLLAAGLSDVWVKRIMECV